MVNREEQLGADLTSLKEATKLIGNSDDYYVYIIWKMYTETPIPFYVGKGHWQRLIKHEMKSDENNNVYKTNIIKKHKRLGINCCYTIINLFKDEEEALIKEKELISLIGRADLKQGPLANKTEGGDGTLGHLAPKGGDSYSARPVIANNKRYSCLKDAGIALGVESGSVSSRINNGWEGYFYEDEGQKTQTKTILGRYRKPVIVQGKKYVSVSEASRKLDIDVRMISKRIGYGWEGYYYIDEGQLPRKTVWGSRKDKVAVIIRGKKYETVAEAVEVTGETTAMISKRCLSSSFSDYSRVDGKIVNKETPPKFPEAVVINSIVYNSLGIAAEHLKLTDGGVAYRCRSNNYPNWQFKNKEKQEKESFIPEFSSNPVHVCVDGVDYESQSSAASANGIDINTVKARCRSYSFPQWVCEGVEKNKPVKPTFIYIKIEGREYDSISMASRDLGFARDTIRRRLISDDWTDYEGVLIKP